MGDKTERRLWDEGILTWDDFVRTREIRFIPTEVKNLHDDTLAEAVRKLERRDAGYFGRHLKGSAHWRLYEVFRAEAVCLDIETNGLPAGAGGYVTVVGLYGGGRYTSMVKGRDLSGERVSELLSGYKYMITFYGSVFDVPFMRKALPGFETALPHFDLCFGARQVGLKGGLKKIEAELGIARDSETVGMDGYEAVRLWQRHLNGDADALRVLLKYNMEDTVNLSRIADTVYGMLRSSTGIEVYM